MSGFWQLLLTVVGCYSTALEDLGICFGSFFNVFLLSNAFEQEFQGQDFEFVGC